MANTNNKKPSNKKTNSSIKKNVKKQIKKASKNKGVVVLFVVLVIIIVAAAIGGYVVYSPKVASSIKQIEEVKNILENDYFESFELSSDINLPNKLDGYDVVINYESSDKEVLSSSGKVSQPLYSVGDKLVTVKVDLIPSDESILFNIFWGFLGKDETFNLSFKVLAIGASSEEKVNLVANSIFVPSVIFTDVGLLQEQKLFDDVTITWNSSNNNILDNTGKKKDSGEVTLTALVKSGDFEKELSFEVDVRDEPLVINELNIDFNEYPSSTYASNLSKDNITYVGSIFALDDYPDEVDLDSDSLLEITDKVMRMKATSSTSAYFVTNEEIKNPRKISFKFGLYKSDSSKTNKASYLNVYYSDDHGETYQLLNILELCSQYWTLYERVLDLEGDILFKVEFVTTYSELRLDLDDFIVDREINEEDIKKSLINTFSPKFTSDRILPLTTIYGGVINWSSNSPNLTSDGIITKTNDSQNIKLAATITGFNSPIVINFDALVTGNNSVVPVEIYFIDIGKYGLSDCGESILIKYGSIDFLIDCGDDISTSKQAVREAIEAYSEDKILDYLLITHPDSDHVGGAPYVLETFEVLNIINFNGTHTSKLYQKYKAAAEAEGALICNATESLNNTGDCKKIIGLGDNVYIEIIDTTHYDGAETNTRSVVCVLNAYGTRVLFTGDADNGSISTQEVDYMNNVGNIDILKVVHHGTANGTTLEYLRVVDPEVAIICNGNYLGNKHGHPTPAAINRIYQYDSNIRIYTITGGACNEVKESKSAESYRCIVDDAMVDRNGTIYVLIDNNGYSISSEYYGDNPLELSSTNYWKTNPWKEFTYQGN